MMQLHQDKEKFENKDIKIIVICPEREDKIRKFLDKEPLDLTFVSDPTHTLADNYNQQVKLFKLGRMPAQILINQDGNKVLEHFANSMADIIENEEILAKV